MGSRADCEQCEGLAYLCSISMRVVTRQYWNKLKTGKFTLYTTLVKVVIIYRKLATFKIRSMSIFFKEFKRHVTYTEFLYMKLSRYKGIQRG